MQNAQSGSVESDVGEGNVECGTSGSPRKTRTDGEGQVSSNGEQIKAAMC
jgi:hypothetical protein